jgi:hypothetical protein
MAKLHLNELLEEQGLLPISPDFQQGNMDSIFIVPEIYVEKVVKKHAPIII